MLFSKMNQINEKYKTQLSSKSTFMWRYVLPLSHLVAWIVLTPLWIKEKGWIGLIGVVAFYLTYLFSRFFFFPLCYVECDDCNLYVSNFNKTEVIPLSNIKSIEDQSFFYYCNIFFKNETLFGKSILFKLPQRVIFISYKSHPKVSEFKKILKNYQHTI